MTHSALARLWLVSLLFVTLLIFLSPVVISSPKPTAYWLVDDIRPGMKGYGCSVFKGIKTERFDAEVLGVLKNVNPGRDLVLVRIAGCNLEKTGVIAGMSGSPVYVEGKLLGAVAYAWAFGKEPIAGVTPFCQMVEFVESYERRDVAKKSNAHRAHLTKPIRAGGRVYHRAAVSNSFDGLSPEKTAAGSNSPLTTTGEELWLVPLKTPLMASGFTQHSLNLLGERTRWAGMMPMQGGSAPAHAVEEAKAATLEPGSPLAVALVTGDFDLSGIGTVTHVEGNRVYGWGHPFLSVGTCEFPLMSGYIHTIYPRQSVSFKMGSPVRSLGVISADVSTCIAGWLGPKADMLPLHITICRNPEGAPKLFRCDVVRQKALMPQLVYAALTNSVDMEGDLPEELTAEMEARFEFENRPPLVIHDVYSGPSFSGGRAPGALFAQIANLLNIVTYNQFEPVRIKQIECNTHVFPGRITAEMDGVQLDSEVYAPGETLKATVYLKPYKGARQRVPVRLKLPADVPEGNYSALICDDLANARFELRESPILSDPSTVDQLFQALELQASARRTNLVVRIALQEAGVALDGQALPNLPGSVVEMMANSRRTGAQTIGAAIVSRRATDWVIQGSQSIKFVVTKNKHLTEPVTADFTAADKSAPVKSAATSRAGK